MSYLRQSKHKKLQKKMFFVWTVLFISPLMAFLVLYLIDLGIVLKEKSYWSIIFLLIMALFTAIHLILWRCVSCRGIISTAFAPSFCPQCSIQLSKVPPKILKKIKEAEGKDLSQIYLRNKNYGTILIGVGILGTLIAFFYRYNFFIFLGIVYIGAHIKSKCSRCGEVNLAGKEQTATFCSKCGM